MKRVWFLKYDARVWNNLLYPIVEHTRQLDGKTEAEAVLQAREKLRQVEEEAQNTICKPTRPRIVCTINLEEGA